MATRVNVRFVTILSGVLVAVFLGVAATAYIILSKSAEDHARHGDEMMQAGDYDMARRSYSRAVNREPLNVEYLSKWREALERWVPESRIEFEQQFQEHYHGLIRQKALAKVDDVDAHDEFLNLIYRQLQLGSGPGGWRNLIQQTNSALEYFRTAEDTEWHRLLRYRGIAVAQLAAAGERVDSRRMERAYEDLERAMAADPSDVDSAIALGQLWLRAAEDARRQNQHEQAREHASKAFGVLESFLDDNPDHPEAMLMLADLRLNDVARRAMEETGSRAVAFERTQALAEELGEVLDTAERGLREAPAEQRLTRAMHRFRSVEQRVSPETGLSRTQAVLAHRRELRPEDIDLLIMDATLRSMLGEHARAIELLQEIVDMPDRPIGIDGMRLHRMRTVAVSQQADLAFRLWDASEGDEEVRTEAKAMAERFREAYGQQVPSDTPRLLLLDAQLQFARGDRTEARRLLRRYTERRRQTDRDALWLLSRIASERENWTEARRYLEEIIQANPNDVQAMTAMAEAAFRDRDMERAVELYRAAAELNPRSQSLADRLAIVETAAGKRQADDPQVAAAVEARRLAEGDGVNPGDLTAAIESLRRSTEQLGYPPRLVEDLVQFELSADNIVEAEAVVRRARQAHPDDEGLHRLERAMEAEDTLGVLVRLIEESGDSELDQQLRKRELFRRRGDSERAAEALRRAVEIEPENPEVLTARFGDAMQRRDLEEAEALLDVLASADVDGARGLSYRARFLAMSGKHDEAMRTLDRAIERRGDDVSLLRLKARLQSRLGRGQDAVQTYQEALSLRGNDPSLLAETLATLMQIGRDREALDFARRYESLARGNPVLTGLRLDLEGRVGDRGRAIDGREAMLERHPDDEVNARALASLYIDVGRWNEARELIDRLWDETRGGIELATIDARWHADRGDISAAREVFRSYIRGIFEDESREMTSRPYMAFGTFLLDRGHTSSGLDALRTARRWQRPESMEVDRALGDALLRLGRVEDAAEAYLEVVENDADDDSHSYRKRLAEALIRAGKYDDAREHLGALAHIEDRDPVVLLLRTEIAKGEGNLRAARELLNEAAGKFPENDNVFFQRALLVFEQGLYDDAMADLNTALELNPGSWQAMRTRGVVHSRRGNRDRAVRDFRRAVEANPEQDELVVALMNELINQGRTGDAVSMAESVIDQRPRDLQMIQTAGDVFARRDDWSRARWFYRMAWERGPSPQTARRYVQSLLEDASPRLSDAEGVFRELGDQVDRDPNLLVARSRVFLLRRQTEAAYRDLTRAFRLADGDPRSMIIWYSMIEDVYEGDRSGMLAYLEHLRGETRRTAWVRLFQGETLARESQDMSRGVSVLESLTAESQESVIRRLAFNALGRAFLRADRFEEAADAWQRGLRAFDQDWEMANNLAFVLAEHLDRAEDAIPLAEMAASRASQVPEVHDTLGWAYALAGRLDEAERSLQRALELAGGAANQPVSAVHLAWLYMEREDFNAARSFADQARQAIEQGAEMSSSNKRHLEQIVSRLDGAG